MTRGNAEAEDRRPLTIAAAQSVPVRGDLEANLEAHLRLVVEAAGAGADLVLFPELSLTGYELDLAHGLALEPGDPRTARLAEASVDHGLTVVAGAPVRLEGRLHIGSLVFTPGGRERVYTKRHLGAFARELRPDGEVPPPESAVFEPGNRDPLLELGAEPGDAPAALAICADTGQPEHARAAAERGARLYLASLFVIPEHLDAERRTLAERAREHGLVVAMANFGGPTGGLPAAGRSAIWSAGGELLAELGASGCGLAIAERTAGGWTGRAVEGVRG